MNDFKDTLGILRTNSWFREVPDVLTDSILSVDYLQPDATRCGGLTAVWEIADLGHAFNLPVTPHHGDMMQAQLNLVMAHPACSLLEYIPWTLGCFVNPVVVTDGHYHVPREPGAGTTLKQDALERFSVR